jgi:hypothetical protein
VRKIIFSHIPKAAGTAVRIHLFDILPPSSCVLVHDWPGCVRRTEWPTYEVPKDWRLLTGHLKARDFLANPHIAPTDSEIIFFSVVRDPIDRMLSLYSYVRTTPKHPAFTAMQNVRVEQFLLKQPANYQSDWLDLPVSLNWTVIVTDVAHLRSGLCMLAHVSGIGDVAISERHLKVYNATAKLDTGVPLVSRAELAAGHVQCLQARHERDYRLLDLIAQARGALCFNASASNFW